VIKKSLVAVLHLAIGINCLGSVSSAQVHHVEAKKEILRCHSSSKYFVIEKETKNRIGTDFLIKPKSNKTQSFPCKYLVAKNDFEIKNEDAEYFIDLVEDKLILDSGTSPDLRNLVIWDLSRQRKAYIGSYSQPVTIGSNTIEFWGERRRAVAKECPQGLHSKKLGLRTAIETRVILNSSNFNAEKTTKTRCVLIQ
jgi:hypothetical protein